MRASNIHSPFPRCEPEQSSSSFSLVDWGESKFLCRSAFPGTQRADDNKLIRGCISDETRQSMADGIHEFNRLLEERIEEKMVCTAPPWNGHSSHATESRSLAQPFLACRLRGTRVRWPRPRLAFPLVSHFLERILKHSKGCPPRTITLAIQRDGTVIRFHERSLGVARRIL